MVITKYDYILYTIQTSFRRCDWLLSNVLTNRLCNYVQFLQWLPVAKVRQDPTSWRQYRRNRVILLPVKCRFACISICQRKHVSCRGGNITARKITARRPPAVERALSGARRIGRQTYCVLCADVAALFGVARGRTPVKSWRCAATVRRNPVAVSTWSALAEGRYNLLFFCILTNTWYTKVNAASAVKTEAVR